jgi:ubiquinone/menaquinone biosynthesis C-methylase UbiE
MAPHKFPAEGAAKLHEGRSRAGLDPRAVVAEAGVASRETVLDLGAGSGFFTLVLSEAVGPDGRVIAADVSSEMLETLRQRTLEVGVGNLRIVPSEEQVVPLADASVDRAFLVDVLHEAEDPAALAAEVARVLRRGGEAVVVDWVEGEGPPGPPAAERLGLARVRELLTGVGLVPGRGLSSVPAPHFGLQAHKPEDGA